MGIGTRLDQKSTVFSFEEEVGYDQELDAPITLGLKETAAAQREWCQGKRQTGESDEFIQMTGKVIEIADAWALRGSRRRRAFLPGLRTSARWRCRSRPGN